MPHTPALLERALVWFRRDLRLEDHTALRHALQRARQVWCAFVFDTDILHDLPRADRRVDFIHASLTELDRVMRDQGGGMIVLHGSARTALPRLAQQLGVQAVFMNHDDEPTARDRDAHVRGALANHGIALYSDKDHVIFERDEVLTASGTPYNVFTPYKNAWLKRYEARHPDPSAEPTSSPLPSGQLAAPPAAQHEGLPSLADLGFEPAPIPHLPPGTTGARQLLANFLERIDRYDQTRDFPALKGPSYLSVHLRFGTVSIRELVSLSHARAKAGSRGAEVWLSELIWRDFYMQVLYHHPHVVERCFQPACDGLRWEHGRHAEALFAAWCEGRTGYPLVDAAMRQINQTGYMHNRLRMVTASFLTKDLGIDWRRGEAYFARHLNDFDLAANNGGWQWAASTGCDAQPYFRIFNPISQSEKFDAAGRFIRRYVPELGALPDAALHAPWRDPVALAGAGIELGKHYPEPVVDHEQARQKTLERFARIKKP